MKRNSVYSNLGYTPREDGTFFVYELDWNHVHKFLCERATKSKARSSKIGPFRVRIAKAKP